MDIKDIKAVIDLMKKNSVTEFEMEKGEFKIRLQRDAVGGKRGAPAEPMVLAAPPAVVQQAAPAQAPAPVAAPAPAESAPAPAASSGGAEVKSPMIGTFYRRPSPDAEPYVEVGTQVEPDTVVCIIEAMKVMNEIKAETRGVITEILLDDAKPVEYGQALYRIDPN
ncbi:MAG: acetyl-CoA carboxylase, biotin carboxyl carrier protein [Verrucomicrobiales bacterium]|nr:acetyl-CoA carboxylase, biotin carboxyl carrier protein [Verrucomicrobiales bacterium]|tara:strand:- start:2329 stop:2826 length:498 start_codon:yes stop_codon:yes gene_type:complete